MPRAASTGCCAATIQPRTSLFSVAAHAGAVAANVVPAGRDAQERGCAPRARSRVRRRGRARGEPGFHRKRKLRPALRSVRQPPGADRRHRRADARTTPRHRSLHRRPATGDRHRHRQAPVCQGTAAGNQHGGHGHACRGLPPRLPGRGRELDQRRAAAGRPHLPRPAALPPPRRAGQLEPLPGGAWQARFAEPQFAVAPGQAAVFYSGDEVLGGGWIA